MSKPFFRSFALLVLAAVPAAPGQTAREQPLTLRGALERALSRAPEVAAARAGAEAGTAEARLSEDAFAPQAFATTTPGYSSGIPVAVAGRVPAVAGVELRKTIYDASRRSQALESRARAAALEGAFDHSSAETARAVVASYGRVFAEETLVSGARRKLEAAEAIHRRVSALRREGRRTDLDVENAALQVARAKQKLADQQAERDLDQLELKRLVDWPSSEPLRLAEDPLAALPEPSGAEDLAAVRAADPERRALEREVEALEGSVALQRRAWLPVVEAEAQYLRLARYNNFDQYFVKFKADDWAVGVSVVLPLWTGGRLTEGRTAARARLEQARQRLRAREGDLELLARRAAMDAERAAAQLALARRAAGVAAEELRVARALADEGRGEPDAADSKEVALAGAQDDVANAAQGVLTARARRLELRGELQPSLAPAPAATGAVSSR